MPSILTEPRDGGSRSPITLSSVVLPQPDGPISETNSFVSIANEVGLSASVIEPSWLRYVTETSSTSINGERPVTYGRSRWVDQNSAFSGRYSFV